MVLTDKRFRADGDTRAKNLLHEISSSASGGKKNFKILTNHLKGVLS